VFSVHNYHFLCSRVTLWYQDRTVCENYREGLNCTTCHAPTSNVARLKGRRRLRGAAKSHPSAARVLLPIWRSLRAIRRRAQSSSQANTGQSATVYDIPRSAAPAYAKFRETNLALCREVFDHVLAVSERTGDIVKQKGVPADKVDVSYIGTSHYAKSLESRKIDEIGDGLSVGYIGYMAVDKGFVFFIECLERIPAAVARTMRVTVAARNTDEALHVRLQRLVPHFRELRYFDGYTHDTLDEVLAGVNLGVIPVLWEDNLPQTAIELVSRGIPILTSDRGGAQEIAHNPAFTFTAGAHDDFVARICRLANRDLPLADFWNADMRIFSMDAHVADLMRYYRPTSPPFAVG
jgi:glycosyltransferase involved in cell wall biosynthesis